MVDDLVARLKERADHEARLDRRKAAALFTEAAARIEGLTAPEEEASAGAAKETQPMEFPPRQDGFDLRGRGIDASALEIVECSVCHGKGGFMDTTYVRAGGEWSSCNKCQGLGVVYDVRRIHLALGRKIPAAEE